MPEITSLQNPKIKQCVKLRDRRARDKTKTFLIEGYRELLRATDGSHKIDTLFICSELFLGSNEDALIERIKKSGAEIIQCAENVFRKISYRDRPDGLVAIAPQSKKTLQDLEKILKDNKAPFLVVAEAIEKPGNLGTILRSSDASGVDALIVCDKCTDIFNPNVVRASVGTMFTVPVIETTTEELMPWLKDHSIKVAAATPAAEKVFTELDMKGPIAIAVGTEQLGLSDIWMDDADIQLRIPMLGNADSLNVATATTLLLYEVVRQRK
ncbi:MAG: RNA methyltransferase [Waddliaceae bacterium]|nr:RNA methyltransferase [Waddliaceae bacterium]MBT3578739.1 RNA methyltransferase [Waddliaceae bacterium]MBT4444359.1 RNA methyltransferase [Waddliaceae bacterium]MBT6928274.1 RNA methyltransferase [Waddliaceae bacterium]MBT7264960.1 RNA methyltransferase [Waddliaceae bacterium]